MGRRHSPKQLISSALTGRTVLARLLQSTDNVSRSPMLERGFREAGAGRRSSP
jgi:hypothetical protein